MHLWPRCALTLCPHISRLNCWTGAANHARPKEGKCPGVRQDLRCHFHHLQKETIRTTTRALSCGDIYRAREAAFTMRDSSPSPVVPRARTAVRPAAHSEMQGHLAARPRPLREVGSRQDGLRLSTQSCTSKGVCNAGKQGLCTSLWTPFPRSEFFLWRSEEKTRTRLLSLPLQRIH